MTEHLISRPATLVACPRCGEYTITAIADGLTVSADPNSLNIGQEIAARLAGKTTYNILMFRRGVYLQSRGLIEIKAPRRHTVAAAHQCTPLNPRPAPKPDIPLLPAGPGPLPDDPPF